MTFNEIKRIIDNSQDSYDELKNCSLNLAKIVTDVCYLHVVDNMLSFQFLQFLIDSKFDFAIFPSYTDSYNYDIQIRFDV